MVAASVRAAPRSHVCTNNELYIYIDLFIFVPARRSDCGAFAKCNSVAPPARLQSGNRLTVRMLAGARAAHSPWRPFRVGSSFATGPLSARRAASSQMSCGWSTFVCLLELMLMGADVVAAAYTHLASCATSRLRREHRRTWMVSTVQTRRTRSSARGERSAELDWMARSGAGRCHPT